ncbi:hypothetical protein L6164_002949 [Bauhinia variegata]|uniref:Uncharacterized protein n=1 Tax=Bauhinia variegata TaxID=167791 RepID=A0ACB9Q1Q6_BAUVA|nr:hypothetical protein L6164_002949 [Bauhinia variegata]
MPSCCSCFPLKKCTHSRSPSPRPIASPQTELTDDAHSRSPSPRPISSPQTELTDDAHSRSPSPRPISSPQTELTDDAHSRSPSPRPISSPQTESTDDDEFHSSPTFADEAIDNRFHTLSSSEKGATSYDVFISCIDGYQDNRMGFFYHLICSLQSAGLAVYRDVQGHRKGVLRANFFSSASLKDIERSRVCIVIFSSAFASSRCCLEEVEKIMEFHTTIGQIVLPVFYNVEQREVHRQSGTFGEFFVKLLKKISATKDKELSWRRALTKAAGLKGWHLTDSLRVETEIIDSIREKVRHQRGNFGEAFQQLINRTSASEYKVRNWKRALTEAANLSGWDSRSYSTDVEVIDDILETITTKIDDNMLWEYAMKLLILSTNAFYRYPHFFRVTIILIG